MRQPTLSGIYIYPIKSCRGVASDRAKVSAIGLEGDRRWQVIDGDGRGLTQRQHKVFATVSAEPHAGGLRLSAPGMADLGVDRPAGAATTAMSHFRVPVAVLDGGDEAAGWFSDLTGESVRLVTMADEVGWRLPEPLDAFGQGAPFTDAAPILVTTESSLSWLQSRASAEFGMDRFRPNLVLADTEPWDEDTWVQFRIGPADVRAVLPWPRCAIPQIDQMTAVRHKEPAKVLREHRWCSVAPSVPEAVRGLVEGSGLFGVGCSMGPVGAELSIGDVVDIGETTAPVLAMT